MKSLPCAEKYGNTALLSGRTLYFPTLTDLSPLAQAERDRTLNELESEVERHCRANEVVVVNCSAFSQNEARHLCAVRAGAVPLRWGAPRILLVSPKQGQACKSGEELARIWQLWRYQFDPATDLVLIGSPNMTESALRTAGVNQ